MLQGFYLTLQMGPAIAVPVPQPVTDALMSVQVTTTDGQLSGFQLSFALSKQSLLNTALLPAGFFDPLIRVIIVATINGIPNVLMDSVITRQEISPSDTPGQSKLTVTGEDLITLMSLVEFTGLPYPNMPDEAIIAFILLKYLALGVIPAIIPSLFPDVSVMTEWYAQQEGTDLEYVQKLAKQNSYVFYLEPGPAPGTSLAYWGPKIRVGVPQPALNINMDAETNVESLSFSLDGKSKEQLILNTYDPSTHKIPIVVPVPDVGLLRPPLGARPTLPFKIKVLGETTTLNPIKAMLYGLGQTADGADVVSGSGQLDVLRYGHVLKARGLVGVRGVGLTYDGLYYVSSVTHSIKRGEYKQSFNVVRDGLLPTVPRVLP